MASFLLVTWDGGGNTPPMRAIAAALAARGHRVRVVGPPVRRESYESLGAEFEPYRHAPVHDGSDPATDILRDWEARTPIGAFARIRDNLMFGPAREFAQEVLAAVERERPSAALTDYMLMGAGAGAAKAGIPTAALVHNVYPLPTAGVPPFGLGLAPARGAPGRIRDRALRPLLLAPFDVGLKKLNATRRDLGLAEVAELPALLNDFDRVLVVLPPEFDFAARAQLPQRVRYVGHAAPPQAADGWESPWPADDSRPLVVIGLSTTFMDQRPQARRILQALDGMPVRALFTLGPALDLEGLPVPDNVEVTRFVPHAAVMPHASAVITHAGFGTIAAALTAGVPVVCMPAGRDQMDNAARVVDADAGVRVSPRARPAKIRSALERVLSDPGIEAGARRMQEAFSRDGTAAAVDELERLAAA